MLGFHYLRYAVELAIKDITITKGITKVLYPEIAKQFNTSCARVERAIRHAIEVSSLRGDTDFLDELFGYTINSYKGKATNGEFISTVADYILLGGDNNE